MTGSITIDGKDYRDLDLKTLRQLIGYVQKETVLIDETTIRENMLLAKRDASDNEIEEALKAAEIWEFINEETGQKGINTEVGKLDLSSE